MEKHYTLSKNKSSAKTKAQQNLELTVAHTMNSLLQTSGLNEDSRENH